MKTKSFTQFFALFFSVFAFTLVGAFGQATLTAPASAEVSSTVNVKYAGEGPDDGRITLGTDDGAPLAGANPADLSGEETGSVDILMPDTAGAYQIIYYSGDTVLATREIVVTPVGSEVSVAEIVAPVAVVETVDIAPVAGATTVTLKAPVSVVGGYAFEVVWAGPANNGDRLVLVNEGEPDQIISYAFLDPLSPRAVLATNGAVAGVHEIQYRNLAGENLATQEIEVLAAPTAPVSLTITAGDNVGFSDVNTVGVILDASGSMLQDQAGEDKINIAKDTVLDFMKNSLPAETPFALRTFGHIEEGSCESELLIPLSPLDYEGMAPIVRDIKAINLAKTPIAAALEMMPSDLGEGVGQRTIVLLTDGKETCDGDPAAVIRSLRANGTNVRVNVVGYDIKDDDLRQEFETWAALGGGRYFDAPEGEELAVALRGAVAVPYEIYSEDILIATGVTGRTAHNIQPGTYELKWNPDAEAVISKTFTITADGPNEVAIP